MKIPAFLLAALAGWVLVWKINGDPTGRITEDHWQNTALLLGLALLTSLAAAFARAGRIGFEQDRFVVSTPFGFVKIPYSGIETIRRCRRRGRPQQLQIIFRSPDGHRILRIRPRNAAEVAARLRRNCPHLSSSSDVTLMRNVGEGELIHSIAT